MQITNSFYAKLHLSFIFEQCKHKSHDFISKLLRLERRIQTMKITKSQIIALLACILLFAWFLFHNMNAKSQPDQSQSSNTRVTEESLPSVVVVTRKAKPREQVFKFFGQAKAKQIAK